MSTGARPDRVGYYEKQRYRDPSPNDYRTRPLLKNPMRLLDRNIEPIHERLLDLLEKLAGGLSPAGAQQLPKPDGRLMSISVNDDDNKITMVTLLVHDIPHAKVIAHKKWIQERCGNPEVQLSRNLMTIYWKKRPIDGNPKLMELAHIITFMGPVQLTDMEQFDIPEDEVFTPSFEKEIFPEPEPEPEIGDYDPAEDEAKNIEPTR